jgi:hypothetical protein
MAVRSSIAQVLDAQLDKVRALRCEFVLWPESASAEIEEPRAGWRSTIDRSYDGVRRALARQVSSLAIALEDAAGRLHVWLPRSRLVEVASIVQRIALEHELQCLVGDDGEWLRSIQVDAIEPLQQAIDRLYRGVAEWIVVEAGHGAQWFVQLGPRTLDDRTTVELVSNRYLPSEQAHPPAVLRRLSLLQWKKPDRAVSDLYWCERPIATSEDRTALVHWLWRSWDVAFGRFGIASARLRTLSP